MTNITGKINTEPLSGFMELNPADQRAFNHFLDTIQHTYESFGFIPINTPTIERAEVLLAKAGGETAKQIYYIDREDKNQALRFDLTVPLARYVAQHYGELTFPFKRYHIDKVYRGERAQAGRFREFFQADIDIIAEGNLSLINDAEIVVVINEVFRALAIADTTIHINNRKILNGFFTFYGLQDKVAEILREIDKIAKVGQDSVKAELIKINISEEVIDKILSFIQISGNDQEIFNKLDLIDIDSPIFIEGITELKFVKDCIKKLGVDEAKCQIDLSIARGLDYYTGTVYETFMNQYPGLGSICSGGRYQDLASYYTDKQLAGVGISIGVTRLFYQLKKLGLINNSVSTETKVLIAPITTDLSFCLDLTKKIRDQGIAVEIYCEDAKFKKKMTYADQLGIPYVIIIGDDEISQNILTVKDMKNKIQEKMSLSDLIKLLKRKDN